MNATAPSAAGDGVALTKEQENTSLNVTLAGIDGCLRRWKVARHEGQAVLTGLSNAVLLRKYVDKGRSHGGPRGTNGGSDGGEGGAVWGALATAGGTVSRVSVAAEARVRRLHGDLSGLQDAMLAAAGGIRGHAQGLRRRCCSPDAKVAFAERTASGVSDSDGDAADVLELEEASAMVGGGYGLMDVADAASEVAEMMLKEALVTATVVQGVGGGGGCREDDGGREALTMYSAAWMMQPYVDAQRVKELEMMVGGNGGGGGQRA